MSKRKFKKGPQVKSLDEFFLHDYFIVNGKTHIVAGAGPGS